MEALSNKNALPDWTGQVDHLLGQLAEMERGSQTVLAKAQKALKICQKTLMQLEETVRTNGFRDVQEEVFFFKEVKPKIYSRLIYYYKLFNIEVARPVGNAADQTTYLKKELDRIKEFFDDNKFFYQYFRSGETYLDEKLFQRREETNAVPLQVYDIHPNPSMTTQFDYILSRVLANEMLLTYLNTAITLLTGESDGEEQKSGRTKPAKTLLWTESKTALIELVYAFKARGSFNHGKATLKDITEYLQLVFSVEISNPSRDFQDILSRKKSYTSFLDALKESYVKYIDKLDER